MMLATLLAGRWIVLGAALAVLLWAASGHAGEAIVLENEHLRLRFDGATGAWTGLVDKKAGQELAVAEALGIPGGLLPARLDDRAIRAALDSGTAISIAGTWRFSPEAELREPQQAPSPNLLDAGWATTPVPSRADEGDRKLAGKIGGFWYRTTVTPPAGWAGKDLVLVLGAADDFDTTFFNGEKIGQTGAETPRHWETPRRYVIPAARVQFGKPNSIAIRVYNAAYAGGIAGPVLLARAEALPEAPVEAALRQVERSVDGVGLTLHIDSGRLRIRAQYRLQGAIASRQFTIENGGKERHIVRGAAYLLPAIRPGEAPAAIFPDSLPAGDQPLEKLDPSATVHPSSRDGLAMLWSEPAARGIGAWVDAREEYAPAVLHRQGGGGAISHHVEVMAALTPGASVHLPRQYIWLARGTRDDLLSSTRSVWDLAGLRPPDRRMPDLARRVIYCAHPGGMPERHFRGFGGFKAMQGYLPTLKKMGIDLLWLLPIFEHGDGRRWNLYSPFDQFHISGLYGTPEEFRRFLDAARDAKIDLMFDLVPHGPPDHTPLAKAHPEWVCRDEAGASIYVWGQLAFDNAHAGWQAYMQQAAAHHARQNGIAGVRVDVASGSPPNWAFGDRPSRSTLGGGVAMCEAIRRGLLEARSDAVLLPEEYTGARAFDRVADLTYDAQLFFLMVELEAKKATPQEWADRLQRFLHDQSLSAVPGTLKMRWVANHDSVATVFQAKRPRDAFGPERARALHALCCLIDGVPMIYQGEEDPSLYGGKGAPIVDDLARCIEARKRLPALARGDADYASIHATGGVFACLRRHGPDVAIVLVSFNPHWQTIDLQAPEALRAVNGWRDELTRQKLDLRAIPMAGHQARVLAPVEAP